MKFQERDALFTVIIAHYNQLNFLYQAIDSVVKQTYSNIELIIADDGSSNFKPDEIKKYVEKNKKNNITYFKIARNEKNLGTVKNLNNGLNLLTGEYVLFFAADDQLYDSQTLSNHIKTFKEAGEDINIVSGQCYMYDTELKDCKYLFVEEKEGQYLNTVSSDALYSQIAFKTIYVIGASCFKTTLFSDLKLSEKYKMIEDWGLFLNFTRNGNRVFFKNYGALKHRDGGVSNCDSEVKPPHVIEYMRDLLLIQEKEILPFLNRFEKLERYNLLKKYQYERSFFKTNYGIESESSIKSIFPKHPVLVLKVYMRHLLGIILNKVKKNER